MSGKKKTSNSSPSKLPPSKEKSKLKPSNSTSPLVNTATLTTKDISDRLTKINAAINTAIDENIKNKKTEELIQFFNTYINTSDKYDDIINLGYGLTLQDSINAINAYYDSNINKYVKSVIIII